MVAPLDVKHASDDVLLAFVLWREARGEERSTKGAVACSIQNRALRPAWWGKTLLEVITKKWQYSSMTDPHDAQLTTWPTGYDANWLECLEVARGVVAGEIFHAAPGADPYYDVSIPPPRRADPKAFVVHLGRIRFHNLDQDVEPLPPAPVPPAEAL